MLDGIILCETLLGPLRCFPLRMQIRLPETWNRRASQTELFSKPSKLRVRDQDIQSSLIFMYTPCGQLSLGWPFSSTSRRFSLHFHDYLRECNKHRNLVLCNSTMAGVTEGFSESNGLPSETVRKPSVFVVSRWPEEGSRRVWHHWGTGVFAVIVQRLAISYYSPSTVITS